MSCTFRIGYGRSSSGKILDYNTKWFVDKNDAIKYAIESHKPTFVSENNKAYRELKFEQLVNYGNNK